MTFKELNTFQKYCDNQVNFSVFKELMSSTSDNEEYLLSKYNEFYKNSVRMLTSQGLYIVFEKIQNRIEKEKYDG